MPDIRVLIGRGLSAVERGVLERTLEGLGSFARDVPSQVRDEIVG